MKSHWPEKPRQQPARRAVIGWQDPFFLDDIREGKPALSRQLAVRPHHEYKRLIEQDFGMEVVLPSCGARNQEIDLRSRNSWI